MVRQLYSELRTIYETTAEDPHTFRISFKLKDLIDGKLFCSAVEKNDAPVSVLPGADGDGGREALL